MSSDRLIMDLSADLLPIRRRRLHREAGLLLGLGALELAVFVGLGMMRPDMGHMASSPFLLWRIGSLVVLTVITCLVALRSFSPAVRARKGLMVSAGAALAAAVAGAFVTPAGAAGRTLLERVDTVHGLRCVAAIIVLSLPVMATLGALMRSAAPTHPRESALASGVAAGATGALVFAFCCPLNDPLYVVTWYSTGCALVAAAARWLLPRGFRL